MYPANIILGDGQIRAVQTWSDYYFFVLNQFGCPMNKLRLKIPQTNVLLTCLRYKDLIKLDAA